MYAEIVTNEEEWASPEFQNAEFLICVESVMEKVGLVWYRGLGIIPLGGLSKKIKVRYAFEARHPVKCPEPTTIAGRGFNINFGGGQVGRAAAGLAMGLPPAGPPAGWVEVGA